MYKMIHSILISIRRRCHFHLLVHCISLRSIKHRIRRRAYTPIFCIVPSTPTLSCMCFPLVSSLFLPDAFIRHPSAALVREYRVVNVL